MPLNITYEKSALASFLDDLPKLMFQYKMSEDQAVRQYQTLMLTLEMKSREAEKERAWKEKVAGEAREYQTTVSMYEDAKTQERDARLSYEKVEDDWMKTGLGLESLSEMFKTDKSLKVLKDLNEIPAKDYKEREKYFADKAYNLERKAYILENLLHGDIRKAKNIMAGGATAFGGTNPLEWDLADLGLAGYARTYGQASELVKKYYEANPAAMRTALAELEKGELNIELLREKTGYYKGLGVGVEEKAKFRRKERNCRYFSTGLTIGAERSQYNSYIAQNNLLGQIMQDSDSYTDEEIDKQEAKVLSITDEIGAKFGRLMGDKNLTDDKKLEYFRQYKEMQKLGRSKTATHLGVISDPDFVPYWDAIEKAYDTFKTEGNAGVKDAMEQAAQELFGFHEPFDQFMGKASKLKTDYMLSPFKANDQIGDDEEEEEDPIINQETQGWDYILGE